MASRHEFVIKDLAVSIRPESGGGSGGTWLPADDSPPLPWWISPIASVVVNGRILEAVSRTIVESIEKEGELGAQEVLMAFDGHPDGNPAVLHGIREIGAAVVAAAAYQGIGGAVGYPNPDCGGTSFETIPPTITPIVHTGEQIHRVSELPRLRRQLQIAQAELERAAERLAPKGDELDAIGKQIEGARTRAK